MLITLKTQHQDGERREAGRPRYLPPRVSEVPAEVLHYSTRSEIIGSTRVARRAGTHVASSATVPSKRATLA